MFVFLLQLLLTESKLCAHLHATVVQGPSWSSPELLSLELLLLISDISVGWLRVTIGFTSSLGEGDLNVAMSLYEHAVTSAIGIFPRLLTFLLGIGIWYLVLVATQDLKILVVIWLASFL